MQGGILATTKISFSSSHTFLLSSVDVSWENRSGATADGTGPGGVEESGWSTPTSDLQASIPIAGSASSGTIPDIVNAQKRTASRSDKKRKHHHHHHHRRSGEKPEKKEATSKAIAAKISEVRGDSTLVGNVS